MKLNRAHILAGYLLAGILILFPLIEVSLAGWPPRPASVAWRYGTMGIFSRALMTPLLGLLLGSGVALLARQRRAVRVFGVLSALTALFLLFGSGRFLLDALHMRGQVGSDMTARSTLDATTVPALVKLLIGMVGAGVLAYANWSASAARASDVGPGVVRERVSGEADPSAARRKGAPVEGSKTR